MVATSAKPELRVDTIGEWERWLESDPGPDGVRLRVRNVASSMPGITYADALDVALCFGWIDGQKQSLDADYFLQVFTPRRPRGLWSKVNIERAVRLIEEGRMRPAGLLEIDRAKADGRWDAAYRQRDGEIPAELKTALAKSARMHDEGPVVLHSRIRVRAYKREGNVMTVTSIDIDPNVLRQARSHA